MWGAISACAAGSWGTSSAETFAVEVVRAGVKCMGKVNSLDMDRNLGSIMAGHSVHNDEVIRLSSLSVANALFHSQSAAAAADHEHINATVQLWLHLTQASSPQPSLLPISTSSSSPSISNLLLFALQNLAAHSHTANLISSCILPAHLLPLLTPSTMSNHALAASSFAAGGPTCIV